MPLMKRKSKKAFEHNVKAEMEAGKPQKQSLAIAFSVKRKAKKAAGGSVQSGSKDMNYAKGGEVEDSARSESRPMPDKHYNDSKEASRNSGNKPAKEDSWTSRPDIRQSQKGPKTTAIKHPKMVPQDGYSVRLRSEEDDLQDSASVNDGPQRQPPKHDNEEGPDRQGPRVRDMQDEHSTHRKPYAKGGEVEAQDYDHKAKNKYEDDLLDLPPSEDEGDAMAHADDEEGQDRQGPKVPDMEEPHNDEESKIYGYADGGMVDNEEEIEHAASIAAAIMMKMRMDREDGMSGSKDEDQAENYAEGGDVIGSEDSLFDAIKHKKPSGQDSIYAHPDEDQADLSRNAEEDKNMEDQSSFDALRKENYSESEGLEALDQPHDSNLHGDPREDDEENIHDGDIVSAIRRKMKIKSAMTR